MKKFTIFTFGTIVTLSFLMFLSGMNRVILGSIMEERLRISDDYWWLLIPIVLCSIVVYYLIKKPIIYNKHKNALLMFTVGLFITLIIVLSLSVKIRLNGPLFGIYFIADMGLLGALAVGVFGLIISTIFGIIGFLIDKKKF